MRAARIRDANRVSRAPGLLLGIGLGGFVDGIVLHQILQWHHMLTSAGEPMTTVAGLESNTLVDGLFHAATWVCVVVGSSLMLRAWRVGRAAPHWREHIGLMLARGRVDARFEAVIGRLGGVWPDVAQGRVLAETAHRPWPLPSGPWVMAQSWNDLLFAHSEVSADVLRVHVPEPLAIDTFDGAAWLGITPFEISGLRLHGTPPLPRLSRFPELNVRTYVTLGGRSGIWFFSLDAASAVAVAAARRLYRLPYFHADMAIERSAGRLHYRSARTSTEGTRAELEVVYEPNGRATAPARGTLEHWLTERYCLYARDTRGRILRAEIHHPPWPLQPATASFRANTMAPASVDLSAGEPLLHFARRQDVVIWPAHPVGFRHDRATG